MKRQILMRILSVVLSFMLVFGTVYAETQTINDEQTIISEQQLEEGNTNEGENTNEGGNVNEGESVAVLESRSAEFGSEWSALLLARNGGYDEWTDEYYKNIKNHVKDCDGVIDDRKYTEYSRLILALTSMGKDVKNVGGYDMLMPLADFEKVTYQGINGAIWALIALDSGNYEIPENEGATTQATRDMYVDFILQNEINGGGFALSGENADADVTAMALTALAKYKDDKNVASAIDRALNKMSKLQTENGGFKSWGKENAESTAQMIIALCTLGISIDDERFVKNGNTLLDNLYSFKTENGYEHIKGEGINAFATEQCLSAVMAYERYKNGETSLYDMTDKMAVASIENSPLDDVSRAQVAMVFYNLYGAIK